MARRGVWLTRRAAPAKELPLLTIADDLNMIGRDSGIDWRDTKEGRTSTTAIVNLDVEKAQLIRDCHRPTIPMKAEDRRRPE